MVKNKISRPKYGNSKVKAFGMTFDSRREYERYMVLKRAEDEGRIADLKCQVKYELLPAVKEVQHIQLKTKVKEVERVIQKPITYKCDFQYIKDGKLVVEDVKISEFLLPKEYLLKEKMLFYYYRIRIKRVYKPAEEV